MNCTVYSITIRLSKVVLRTARKAPLQKRKRPVSADRPVPAPAAPRLSVDRLIQLRQRLEQVGDQVVVGHLEDRRLLVLVDRHDDFRVPYPARCWMAARSLSTADRRNGAGGSTRAGEAKRATATGNERRQRQSKWIAARPSRAPRCGRQDPHAATIPPT